MGKMGEERAGFGQVAVEPEGGATSDWQQPAFAALALADEEDLGGEVVEIGAGVGSGAAVGRRHDWRGGGAAFAAALHGGNVDGSG